MQKTWLKAGERLDDLQTRGLKIIQNPRHFCFGMDAVLLSHFAHVPKESKVVDLGTGSGIIPLLLSAHSPAKQIIGLELQKDMADMAQRSVFLNGLQNKICIMQSDISNVAALPLPLDNADCILCNPPYYEKGRALYSQNQAQSLARFELFATLNDFLFAASALAKNGARIAFVHRAERLGEFFQLMPAHRIEPKRLMLVQAASKKAPHLMLIEGIKNAKKGLKILPTLYLNDELGQPSQALRALYEGNNWF